MRNVETNEHKVLIGFIVMLCAATAVPQVSGQSEGASPQGVAQDPSGNRNPPPDDPNERDLAKRRQFIHELNHSRINFGCFQYPEMMEEAGNDIPDERKASLLQHWSTLLAGGLVPPRAAQMRWYGKWGTYASRDATGGLERRLDLYVAEWSVGGIVVQASARADSEQDVRFLVRFSRRIELQFRPRPERSEFANEQDFMNWEFVPKTEVGNLLQELFRPPDTPDVPFSLQGHVETHAGIEVFTGTIAPQRFTASSSGNTPSPETGAAQSDRPRRILITDSDPQYVCFGFDVSGAP